MGRDGRVEGYVMGVAAAMKRGLCQRWRIASRCIKSSRSRGHAQFLYPSQILSCGLELGATTIKDVAGFSDVRGPFRAATTECLLRYPR